MERRHVDGDGTGGPGTAVHGGVVDLVHVHQPCLAVGAVFGSGGLFRGMALRWDGAAWAYVSTPPLYQVALGGVSCTSATTCLVVGDHQPFVLSDPSRAVALRWDGDALTAVPGVAVGLQSALGAVSCTRTRWCAAVGSFTTRGRGLQPLVERWSGVTQTRMWAPG